MTTLFRSPGLLPLALGLLSASCHAPPPVDRDDWERQAARLLQPLLTDVDVACNDLLIEISPNYFANVSQPVIDPNLHGAEKRHEDGWDEFVWINRVGDLSAAIKISIGAVDEITDHGYVRGKVTRFTVLREVRLRVRAAGTITAQLDVTAAGDLVWNAGGQIRSLEEFRVHDGVLQAR